MSMNLRDHLEKLHAFATICRLGSIRKAAEELRISQPALTHSVQLLEEATGKKLFIRTSKGVSPTSSGTEVLAFCRNLFEDLSVLEQTLRTDGKSVVGMIRVGTFQSLAAQFWPRLIKKFASQYPSVRISLKNDSLGVMEAMLLSSQIDLMVSILPSKHPSVVSVPLFDDAFFFYASTKSQRKLRSLEDFQSHPIVLVPDAEISPGQTLLRLLWQQGLNPAWTYEVASLEAAREYAIADIGIALLPSHAAKVAVDAGKVKKLNVAGLPKNGFGKHTIAATLRCGDAETPLLRELIHSDIWSLR